MGSQAGGSDGLSELHTTKLAKARMELEQLYMGVPDESVNLTFQDFAEVKHRVVTPPPLDHHKMRSLVARPPANNGSLNKLPSLDFNIAMQASRPSHYHHRQNLHGDKNNNVQESPMAVDSPTSSYNRRHHHHQDVTDTPRDPADSTYNMMMYNSGQYHKTISPSPVRNSKKQQDTISSSISTHQGMSPAGGYDDMTSHNAVKKQTMRSPRGVRVGRQGIPHSKICTICSTYVYVFRHRCLVCGRVYCRNCVNIGMGEMSEGRKCVECLGRRFSQRYIKRAGKMQGWCCWWSYPEQVKQQELKWAEKGPRIRNLSTPAYNYNSREISRTSINMTPSAMGADAYSYNYKHQSSHHDHLNNPPSFVAKTPSSSHSSPYLNF